MKKILPLFLVACTLSACKEEADPLRIDHSVVPVSQRIILKLDPADDSYNGRVEIKIDVRQATDSFRFHAREMELSTAFIVCEGMTNTLELSVGGKGTVTAVSPSKLLPGKYILQIGFTNNYCRTGTGIYKVDYEGRPYLFTQMEPEHARDSFPCWDAPEFKIPWKMEMTVPDKFDAISNTPVERKKSQTVVFAETKPMPSYLLALAVGEFDSVAVTGLSIPGRIYTAKGKTGLTGEAARMSGPLLAELEKYFDSPYPYRKLDQIAVPEFNYGAMENVGLISYRDSRFLRDGNALTAEQKQRLASIIAHEMAHMWFGNLVTPTWWDDLWLNESFASWIALKMANRAFPEFAMHNNDIGTRQWAMGNDSLSSTRPIRRRISADDEMHNLFDSLAYGKGMALLTMIENWLGEEPFRQGMVHYMQENAWKNADAFDLAKALNTVDDSDVNAIMKSFVTQPGIPLLRIEQTGKYSIRLTQGRYAQRGEKTDESQRWTIPLVLGYFDGKTTRTKKVLLKKSTMNVVLDGEPEWIYPNADEKGYYRWALSANAFDKLATEIRSMGVRERIGFLDNLNALFRAGEVAVVDYLQLLASFNRDPSPEVMSMVTDALGGFYDGIITPELREPYAAFLSAALKPMLDKIGIEKTEGEDVRIESLRANLIGTLGGKAHDPDIRKLAAEKADACLADPYSVDPALAETFLNVAARTGDAELFEKYVKKYESITDPIQKDYYLYALGAFRNPELMQRALAYCLTDAVPPQKCGRIPQKLADSDDTRWIAFQWMVDNYEEFTAKIPSHYATYLPWTVCGQSEDLLKKGEAFLLDESRRTQGMERTFEQVRSIVTINARIREKELPAITRFLQEKDKGLPRMATKARREGKK